jgi:2-phospho-L-lactate guanylyltransferase
VKRLPVAKSRLSAIAEDRRAELAMCLALDTLEAVARCAVLTRIVVVTDDRDVATAAGLLATGRATGPRILVTGDAGTAGLNHAVRRGADVADDLAPGTPIAALPADLPALRPEELDAALTHALTWPFAFVADAEGTGTTLLAAAGGRHSFLPAYGESSAHRHRAAGAHEITTPLPTLRRDVDDAESLAAVLTLGAGRRTAAFLRLVER